MAKFLRPEKSLQRVEILLHGRVQGVSMRDFVEKFFENWNRICDPDDLITGSIGNLPDKTVAVVLEGREPVIERVLALFYMGSPKSQVERVEECKWENIENREFADFARAD